MERKGDRSDGKDGKSEEKEEGTKKGTSDRQGLQRAVGELKI